MASRASLNPRHSKFQDLTQPLCAPGEVRRSTALKRVGGDALLIEIGCLVMLVVAGLIEGFLSPSDISYSTRLAVLGASF